MVRPSPEMSKALVNSHPVRSTPLACNIEESVRTPVAWVHTMASSPSAELAIVLSLPLRGSIRIATIAKRLAWEATE